MRKHHQQQILQLLQIISEAQVKGRFEECLDGAQSIRDFIESTVGQGTHTVAFLKEYCDLLPKPKNASKPDKKRLKAKILKIVQSVISELKPNRIEIAFLSYKASMSDSLESIYLAAKEDPNCDAYWIPIPYFDRRPDTSLGQMHYEGADCYGDNIEITNWQEYDIEARRPDVIFTFSPYDEGNCVTSVHTNYYCKRLRNLTDMLIYVPYFVLLDDVPEHFCTTAGCVYAHKVILQSEKMRDNYISAYKKQYGGSFDHILGKPEDKFIALGSPKFDKVINSKKEDFKLSDQWRSVIGNRKVIFYNTTLGTFLQSDEQYLTKLRSVLTTFQKRKDVVLWWRPHPLMEATLSSMRPQFLNEYNQIVSDYKNEGWGIYDDTADLHRAISLTDAYYGDWSSVVLMYQVTGKPVVIQDVTFNTLKTTDRLYCRQQLHYFSPACDELLCVTTCHEVNGEMSLIDTASLAITDHCAYPVFDSGFLVTPNSYVVFRQGLKSYFAPRWDVCGNHLAIYDNNTHEFEYILLDDQTDNLLDDEENRVFGVCGSKHYSSSPKFGNIFSHNNSLYFIPGSYPAIVRLDLATNKVTYFSDFVDEVWQLSNECGKPVSFAFNGNGVIRVGKKLCLACRWADLVVEFDLETHKSKVILLSKRGYGNHCIQYDGTNFWLFSENGLITRWNQKTQETQILDEYPWEVEEVTVWLSITFFDGNIYALLPTNKGNKLFKIDTNTGTVVIAAKINELLSVEENIISLMQFNEKLYILTDKNKMYELEKINYSRRVNELSISVEHNMSWHQKYIDFNRSAGIHIVENNNLRLEEYFVYVVAGSNNTCEISTQGGAGKRIFEYLRNQDSLISLFKRIEKGQKHVQYQ